MLASKITLSKSLKVFILIQFLLLAIVFGLPLFRKEFSYSDKKATWKIPHHAYKTTNPISDNSQTFAEGKTLYIQKCAGCHGPEGAGDGYSTYSKRLNTPPVNKEFLWRDGQGVVHFKVKEGLNRMPSFKDKLSDEQIWLVVNYIRNFLPATS